MFIRNIVVVNIVNDIHHNIENIFVIQRGITTEVYRTMIPIHFISVAVIQTSDTNQNTSD